MLDSLSLWLHETPLGETLLTMLISMLPVVELRGGLPAGVAMGLPIPVAFAASLVGNMIPVPFIILFVRPLFQWVRIHIPKLEGFISHLEARAEAKSADVLRYQTWGLLIFVAIPLPGTGAWTGALIAAVLNMRLKRAVPVILLGVVIAGCIITLLTHGVSMLPFDFLPSRGREVAAPTGAALIMRRFAPLPMQRGYSLSEENTPF